MRYIFFLLTVMMFNLTSCNSFSKKPVTVDDKLVIKKHTLDIDTDIRCHIAFNTDLVILSSNDSFIVLDSTFNRKKEVEDSLNNIHPKALKIIKHYKDLVIKLENNKFVILDSNYSRQHQFEKKIKGQWVETYGDSTWVLNNSNLSSIDKAYNFSTNISLDSFLISHPYIQATHLLSDSVFLVFGCCFGEFGGTIFFVDKKSGKSYLYPVSSCPETVVNLDNTYFVTTSLEHMGGSTSFIKIQDPRRLYEPHPTSKLVKNSFCCNCDTQNGIYYGLDKNTRMNKDSMIGVKVYYDSPYTLTATTFIRSNVIYSILLRGSNAYLVKHMDDKIVTLDSVNNTSKLRTSNLIVLVRNNIIHMLKYGK